MNSCLKRNLISIAEADLKTSFTPKQSNINIVGAYSANESEFLDLNWKTALVIKALKFILTQNLIKN